LSYQSKDINFARFTYLNQFSENRVKRGTFLTQREQALRLTDGPGAADWTLTRKVAEVAQIEADGRAQLSKAEK
jgi:hypothetical protein